MPSPTSSSHRDTKAPASSPDKQTSRPPPQPAKRPANWVAQHDAFIREQARNGEDAESIRILFEVEYPGVIVSKAWVLERMKVIVVGSVALNGVEKVADETDEFILPRIPVRERRHAAVCSTLRAGQEKTVKVGSTERSFSTCPSHFRERFRMPPSLHGKHFPELRRWKLIHGTSGGLVISSDQLVALFQRPV
ncbi:uncharacterized protein Z519_05752 [Cladophialophora bantiana CBS 173.52]|uniref:Uncharacterized protein n=1 Tax=Cladophialophora bantiana (strain ATCC 10958 / CBS 173.52 / CDC B-1940 / NIH 8579) TaxID=1442370 RepID=A0A0D2G381_CLAB1|nr:uncharacterized protein Z519_05752 [Cladophialophora bantiana CBS 173.52]KIW93147.1 hypothetical protein Z519_05752 [Cladophialophora bantiana CBS 173.52]